METFVYESTEEMAVAAATEAAASIAEAIDKQGRANIILATGASQMEMLGHLTAANSVDWSKVTMFHLDEYIGLGAEHPASFRRYLRERFVDKVGTLKDAHFVDGDANDPAKECHRLGTIIAKNPIDVALVGIGENGHLAFNDPPADFETNDAFIVVQLDGACRKQQLGEGWFETIGQVPRKAISMSIRQIITSKSIIVTVPDRRKAKAVKAAIKGPVSPDCPASILQTHHDCKVFLDKAAASLLR